MIAAKADIFFFFMVFTRVLGLITLVPFFGGRVIPKQIQIALGGGIALLVYPLVFNSNAIPEHGLTMLIFAFTELSIGFLMGFAVRMVFYIAEFAGTLISTETSLMRSDIFDPLMQSNSTSMGTLLFYLCVMLLLVTGMHYEIIRVFVGSYNVIPIGGVLPILKNVTPFVRASSGIFLIGLKIAAPIVALSFIINMTFATLGKAVPKMNVFITSFAVRIIAGLGLLFLSFGLIVQYFHGYIQNIPAQMLDFLSF